jgi:hypothetical protein
LNVGSGWNWLRIVPGFGIKMSILLVLVSKLQRLADMLRRFCLLTARFSAVTDKRDIMIASDM